MRGGQAHDRITDLVPGALALFCPACPQLGINIPPENEWQENERCVDMRIRLLETQMIFLDGSIDPKWWLMEICSSFISGTNAPTTTYHYQMEKCLWWSGLHTRAT
jgi:hypothetical protein